MEEPTGYLPGLSPVAGKQVQAAFEGGMLSSDGGVLLLREVERKLWIADRLAACLPDRRDPARIDHTIAEMIRFRMLAIAAGYEDGDDCDALRTDPLFKMALGRGPSSGDPLCSQPTMSRLENAPSRLSLCRMMAAMVDLFCDGWRNVPSRIELDIDDTGTRRTAANSCRCSTLITTVTGSCRSTSMRRGAASWSPPSCGRARRRAAGRRAPS